MKLTDANSVVLRCEVWSDSLNSNSNSLRCVHKINIPWYDITSDLGSVFASRSFRTRLSKACGGLRRGEKVLAFLPERDIPCSLCVQNSAGEFVSWKFSAV